jgi:(p)ppGpp synthase/HD superfamily hydrolase
MADASTQARATKPGPLVEEALEFARAAHAGHRRKQTGAPFIEHPIAVAALMAELDPGPEVLAAAYLHDVPEKTEVELEEIRSRFGALVASLVGSLTEDPSVQGYRERKRALRAQVLASGRTAAVIYSADRVANLRDWTALPAPRREGVAALLGTSLEDRLELWDEDLSELTSFDSELPFLAEMEIEIRALREPGPDAPRSS